MTFTEFNTIEAYLRDQFFGGIIPYHLSVRRSG